MRTGPKDCNTQPPCASLCVSDNSDDGNDVGVYDDDDGGATAVLQCERVVIMVSNERVAQGVGVEGGRWRGLTRRKRLDEGKEESDRGYIPIRISGRKNLGRETRRGKRNGWKKDKQSRGEANRKKRQA